MPSYIELDKQLSFPASSNVGKLILGVNSSEKATLTDSAGVTTVIGGGELPYKSYVARVLHYGDTGQTLVDGDSLIVGQTYKITVDNGGDFSNVADVLTGSSNTVGCVFRATGTTPINWRLSEVVSYGNPVPESIQYNDLGFNTSGSWVTVRTGQYGFNFETSVDPTKVAAFFTPSSRFTIFSYISSDGSFYNGETNFRENLVVGAHGTPGLDSVAYTSAVSVSGSILIGGRFTKVNDYNRYRALFRTFSDGTIDTDFTDKLTYDGGFTEAIVYIVKVQPDGKILVGGNFNTFNGDVNKYGLVRLNSDGSEDTAFHENLISTGNGTGFNKGRVYDIALQSDGKIIVVGIFDNLNGNSRTSIVRLNSDGTEDVTFYTNFTSIGNGEGFDTGNPEPAVVVNVAVQSDDKIIVTAVCKFYNGVTYQTLLYRFNSDGTFDSTYYTNYISTGNHQGEDGYILTLALQNDDKLLIGGDFGKINGLNAPLLARINVDGTVDTTYTSQLSGDFVSVLETTGVDNVTYIGGSILTHGGNHVPNVIKVTNTAQLVNNFENVELLVYRPISLLPLPFNKLLVCKATSENNGYVHEIYTGVDAFYNMINPSTLEPVTFDKFEPVQFEIRKYN